MIIIKRTWTALYRRSPSLAGYYGRQNILQDLGIVIVHDHVPSTEMKGESSLLILLITDLALSLNQKSQCCLLVRSS